MKKTDKRRKYSTDAERKAARRLQNKMNKRKQRLNEKLGRGTVTSTILPIPPSTPLATYGDSMFNWWKKYLFTYSITLTNNKLVTIDMHNKSVNTLINEWVNLGIISNYIKVIEMCGGNYHTHLLILDNEWGFDFRSQLSKDWGNGFFRINPIDDEEHRLNAIKYCCKHQIADTDSDIMQAITDTWAVSLIFTIDDTDKVEAAKLHQFKKNNGLDRIDMSKHIPKSFLRDSTTGKWI